MQDRTSDSENAIRRLRPAGLAAIILLAVLIVAAIAAATPAAPPKCTTCHEIAAYDSSPGARAHASVQCSSCHAPQTPLGGLQLRLQVLGSMVPAKFVGSATPNPRPEISRQACLECHANVMTGTLSVKGLKIKHSTCAATGSCVACHGEAGHAVPAVTWHDQPVMADCIACHKRMNAPVACNTCHPNEPLRAAIVRGPWQILHGPQWKTMHGQGDLTTCSTCHRPTDCQTCHNVTMPHPADWRLTHGKVALRNPSACTVCHKNNQICSTCHGIQMPHPANFMSQHPKVATSVNDPVCQRCHLSADCQSCHTKHVHPGFSTGSYPNPNASTPPPPFSRQGGGK